MPLQAYKIQNVLVFASRGTEAAGKRGHHQQGNDSEPRRHDGPMAIKTP